MAGLFVIEDYKVKPRPETLLIKEFRELWERDKTKHKTNASLEFTYIEFLHSFSKDNPYAGYDDTIKEQKVIEGVFGHDSTWQPDEMVHAAVAVYIDMRDNASPSLRFYLAALEGVKRLQDYYTNLNMNQRSNSGGLVHKPADVARGLSQTAAILSNLESLRSKVNQESFEVNKTRANRQVNPFER